MRDYRVINATMPSNTTLGTAVDLGAGFSKVYFQLPTMASGTSIGILCAESLAGSYMPVYKELSVNTLTSYVPDAYKFSTIVCAGVHPIPAGLRFLKIQMATLTSDAAVSFRFLVSAD